MKKTLVIGLGATGLSCVRYALANDIEIMVMDSRRDPPGLLTMKNEFPQVPVYLGEFDPSRLSEAESIVLSPGVSSDHPFFEYAGEQKIPIISDIELFARQNRVPIIAVTGSNGKTTVVTLLGKILREAGCRVQVCGNIGLPVLDAVLNDTPDYYVLELSSFQLAHTHSLAPQIAVVLNVSPDHLDRHQTMEAYRAAKQNIYHGAKISLLNLDEPLIWTGLNFKESIGFRSGAPESPEEFGLKDSGDRSYLHHGNDVLMSTDQLQQSGQHHCMNALVCFAVASALGVSYQVVVDVLTVFSGMAHRCEQVAIIDGVRWINDSKGTNIGATKAAIESMKTGGEGRLIVIAGGVGKGADFSMLSQAVSAQVAHLVLFGQDREKLQAQLEADTDCQVVQSLDQAVEIASAIARSGDVVLFSPACASFDMFDNYEHRGDYFRRCVKRLSNGKQDYPNDCESIG